MILKKLDGEQFREILINGSNNLKAHYEEVDNLNVFPVPDGDTGTNMCRTIGNGINAISSLEEKKIGELGKTLSQGMLLGARGNSGVILSQIFRGICKGLDKKEEVNALELGEAFKVGVKQAYGAVITPVEGTILTVYREATEFACKNIKPDSTINEFFELHLKQAKKTLKNTKNLLPVLKEAGVIDSGGAGYTYIVEGIVKYLDGERIEIEDEEKEDEKKTVNVDFSAFGPDDTLQFGYCTEFILRLQNSKVDIEKFDIQTVIDVLEGDDIKGDSIVALKDDSIVKVHVHTKDPGLVLSKMRQFGEFLTTKVENMSLQHNENITPEEAENKAPHKKFALVAVAQGEGIKEQFEAFGVDQIIGGGQTMNPSTEDFLTAFKKINADTIFVFPNNKNIVMAAKQAAKFYKGAEVEVIMSTSIPQCVSALSMLDFTSEDKTLIIGNFNEAIRNVVSGEITKASRNTRLNGMIIKKGDFIGILDGKLVASAKRFSFCLSSLLRKCKDIDDRAVITYIYGEDMSEEMKKQATDLVERKYPLLEISAIDGRQSLYHLLLAIE